MDDFGEWFDMSAQQQMVIGSIGDRWRQVAFSASWKSCAISTDGSILLAVAANDYMYRSTNKGITWTPLNIVRDWRDCCMSANGTSYLYGVAAGSVILRSADSGATWINHTATTRQWTGVACSSSGIASGGCTGTVPSGDGVVITGEEDGTAPGVEPLAVRDYRDIAWTSDGFGLITVSAGGSIWRRYSGWSNITSPTIEYQSCAISTDGSRFIVVAKTGGILIFTNGGNVYGEYGPSIGWKKCASDYLCKNLMAISNSGDIYMSFDYGATWKITEVTRNWSNCALTPDGSKAIAVVDGGFIYLYE